MTTKPLGRKALDDMDDIRRAMEDFRVYLFLCWGHLGLPPPTPVQLDIAYYLQHGPKRKMVQAYRGVGKSWIFAAFITWNLWRNPDCKILVVSATKPFADDISKFLKQLINGWSLLHDLRSKDGQRDTNVSFDVGPAKTSKDPSVKSVGITGQVTGSRADIILADDIESLNNSATETARNRLAEAVKEFDAVVKPGGSINYLGTPQSAMTMYAKLPERGYDVRIWPVRVPEKPEQYGGRLGRYITQLIDSGAPVGSPVDPKRFSDADLLQREASYGRSGFALQFMLDTSQNDALRYPLKLRDLIVMPLDKRMAPAKVVWTSLRDNAVQGVQVAGLPGDNFFSPMFTSPDLTEYQGTAMAIDPSGRGKDETTYAVVKHLYGMLYVTAAGAVEGGYEDAALDTLVRVASLHGARQLLYEANYGDGMFGRLLQAALMRGVDGIPYRASIEEVKHSKQKELRIIDTLEPVMQAHRLVIDEGIINNDWDTASDPNYSLFYQMTRITRERGSLRHDDRLDALAMAVAYWNAQMSQELGKAEERFRQKSMADELRKFAKGVLGRNPKGPRIVHLPH